MAGTPKPLEDDFQPQALVKRLRVVCSCCDDLQPGIQEN